MNNLHEHAASRIQSALEALSVADPWLYWLAVFCDVILDDSLETVATNGVDILVNPHFASSASIERLQAGLSAAVIDAVSLHPIAPEGLSMLDWSLHTFSMLPGHLTPAGGIHITGRLRPPPAGVDLVACWGRRICWLRSFLLSCDENPPGWVPWPPRNLPCIACEHGEHRPFVHPDFEAITRGSRTAPPHVPARAEDCFCTVWGLTSPVLSLDDYQHGLEWLARCGADGWLLVAMKRLLPVLERQGRLRDWLDCCRSSLPLRAALLRIVGLHRREGHLPWRCPPRWLGVIAS